MIVGRQPDEEGPFIEADRKRAVVFSFEQATTLFNDARSDDLIILCVSGPTCSWVCDCATAKRFFDRAARMNRWDRDE